MRMRALFASVAVFSLAGCRLPEDEWGIVRFVWNDFPWWSVVWRLVFWTLLGAAVGLIIGIFLSSLLRRWGLYRLPWGRVRFWLTLVVFTLNILAMPLFFGTIGFFEGLYRSGAVAVRHSMLGKEWLPKVASEAVDVLRFLDGFVENDELNWDAAANNRRPVHVLRLLDNVDKIKGGVAEKAIAKAKEQLFIENPDWKGGVGETVVDTTLPPLIYYLVNKKLHDKLADYGVPNLLGDLRREAEKKEGGVMTHEELTEFLSERVLIPLILFPLKKWTGGMQWSSLGLAALWVVTPVLLMWLTRLIVFWWRRRKIRRLCPDQL
jgi:phosphate/sulfate permease